MTLHEIETRQSELDRLVDCLADSDPQALGLVLQYYHDRSVELDALRPGDATDLSTPTL